MVKIFKSSHRNKAQLSIQLFFIILSLTFIIPLIYVISISFSNEEMLSKFGYRIIPVKFDLTAYKYVFNNPKVIIDAYVVTSFQAFVRTFLAILVMALCAYPLSRSNYKFKKPLTFYIFITMFFSGGLIPSYILNTQYLHLGNTIWIYIFPGLASGFQIIVFRTFFQGLPQSLVEAAKIDGASELRIFFRIIMPLSKPVIATFALFSLLDRWNDWYTSLIYIREQKLYTLQFLLQRILLENEFVKQMAVEMPNLDIQMVTSGIPIESMKFAMCVVVAGPMLFIFPFFQKYFARGLIVGSVKG